jgi:hypothetical protein
MPGQHAAARFATSKAQFRWMWATHQQFAKKWGDTNKVIRPFKILPPRKSIRKKV